MERSAGKRRWISWSPEAATSLPDGMRAEIQDRIRRAARSEKGALLAIVRVRVRVRVRGFEHGAEAQVSRPSDGLLSPDTNRAVVADVVRAREKNSTARGERVLSSPECGATRSPIHATTEPTRAGGSSPRCGEP